MARRFSSNTVRTVGALLPSDVLAKAMVGQGLDGLEPEDYGLQEDERFRDVVNDAWNEARSLWWSFQAELRDLPAEDASASSLTRDRWLIPLLELLDFHDVEVESRSLEVSGTEYPISHSSEGTPLHLMGARVDLDGRVSGIPGAARLSPHSLLQQFLNRSDDHLWGIVSNGLQLRILRDSVSLTRQAFVQFDLEALFNGEVFPDFVLLYRVVHATRFSGERPDECLLERWIAAARDEGIRALEQLRDGVEAALTELGSGFLSHPNNSQLRKMIAEEDLDPRGMYRYLLRLVYRLLFLFVAEDRDLLLVPDTDPEARDRYERFYSTARIRELASRPTPPGHIDLWAGLGVLMNILGKDEGEPALGLPGLGSFLWDFEAIGPLKDSDIDNDRLLEAIRSLAYVREAGTLRRIDFAALGAEELGSVYESLLELHPAIDEEQRTFSLTEGAGSERKTTGSYYTPSELISELLDSALDPVLEEAAGKDDPETAILELKVVDPAAGSGHFLVAAAHRIAKRLAEVRTGEPEPPEDEYRTAVRDVVSRCLFAVDINDLAVELCKVSLWLEALEPGKPLSFLDHHILHGNSLFGATPAAIAGGIPNEAFVALTGDDKKVVTELKKRNRKERSGQEGLPFVDTEGLTSFGLEIQTLEDFDDEDLETVRAKERMLAEWKSSPAYQQAKLVADTWCAAFAIEKTPGAPPLTDSVFRRVRDEGRLPEELQERVDSLAASYSFLHWHLGFPQVIREGDVGAQPGWSGGFDVVLGNPPWEKLKLQEREWFSTRFPPAAQASTKAERAQIIASLAHAPSGSRERFVWHEWLSALRSSGVHSHFMRKSGVFPLGGVGDVNVYAVFADLMRQIVNGNGRAGFICPVGLAVGATYAPFFRFLVESGRLFSFFSFENEELLFPSVHHETKFALVTLGGGSVPASGISLTGYVRRAASVHDAMRRYSLTSDDIRSMRPNSTTAPLFRNARDAEVVSAIYRRIPVLIDHESGTNEWGAKYLRMFDMTNDSDSFLGLPAKNEVACWEVGNAYVLKDGRRFLPLYEGKMIWHFDHRYGSYEGQTQAQANQKVLPHTTDEHHADPDFSALPKYWTEERLVQDRLSGKTDQKWFLAFRDVGPKERTMVPCILPWAAVGNKAPLLLLSGSAEEQGFLLVMLASFAVDYCLRSAGGMNWFVVEQAPVLSPARLREKPKWLTSQLRDFITPRVAELVYTAWDHEAFGAELGFAGAPFRWDPERRSWMRAELDAAIFHEYQIPRTDVDHVMSTFEVSRKYDTAEHGSFRTKQRILDAYDRMAKAIETGEPYQTIVNPPPADPSLRFDAETTG